MNLYTKILLSTLIPLIFISLVWFFQMAQLVTELNAGIQQEYETQAELATSRLDDIAYTHDYVTKVLASSKEIAYAIEIADNNTLYDWGMNFISNKITSVMFVSPDGTVIARAPDEYRFGDNISSRYIFDRLKNTGTYLGIARMDNMDMLACGRVIKKYNEIDVGYVIVATAIDKRLTKYLNYGIDGIIGYLSDSVQLLDNVSHSAKHIEIFYKYNDNETSNSAFHLHMAESPAQQNILLMKKHMAIVSLTALAATFISIIVLISFYLKPYKKAMRELFDFVDKKTDIATFNSRLKEIDTKDNKEVSTIISGLTEMTVMIQDRINQLKVKNEQLDKLAKTDSLTGLYNRVHMEYTLLYETKRSERYNSPLSVILLDIDFFRRINDTFGNQKGDEVLKETAKLLVRNTRNTDITGRWSGEEFMIICPETGLNDAVHVGEKILSIFNCTKIAGIDVKACMGINEFRQEESPHTFIKRAEDALFTAKNSGRNCIRT